MILYEELLNSPKEPMSSQEEALSFEEEPSLPRNQSLSLSRKKPRVPKKNHEFPGRGFSSFAFLTGGGTVCRWWDSVYRQVSVRPWGRLDRPGSFHRSNVVLSVNIKELQHYYRGVSYMYLVLIDGDLESDEGSVIHEILSC